MISLISFKAFVDRFKEALPEGDVRRPLDAPYFILEFWSTDFLKWHYPLRVYAFGPEPDNLQYFSEHFNASSVPFRYGNYWKIVQVIRSSPLRSKHLTLRIAGI